MVVTDKKEQVDEALQPFHEFECTGKDDTHVQDVDVTKEAEEEYTKQTTKMLRDSAGELNDPNTDEFYREPTPYEQEKIGPMGGTGCAKGISFTSKDWGDGRGYRTKVHFTPVGYEEVTVMQNECMSFIEFISYWYWYENPVKFNEQPDSNDAHKYGYAKLLEDGSVDKVIKRTNPNAKWDWWQTGGRWTGALKLKELLTIEDKESMPSLCGFSANEIKEIIKQIRKGEFKLALQKPINFIIYIIWNINNVLNYKIIKGGNKK